MSNLTVKNAKGINVRKNLPKGIGNILIHETKSEIDRLSRDIALKDLFLLYDDSNVFLTAFKSQEFSKDSYDIYIHKVNANAINNIKDTADNKINILTSNRYDTNNNNKNNSDDKDKDKDNCYDHVDGNVDVNGNGNGKTNDYSDKDNVFKQILSFVLYESFQIRNSHKISIYPCTYQIDLIHSVQKTGFIKEGYIKDRFFKDSNYFDCFVYSILSDEFKKLSTGYIKMLKTTLKVRATEHAVFEVSVSDDKNSILSINEPGTNISYNDLAYDNLKYILKQLVEYDSGIRKVFDFNSEFYEATDFQKKVWKINETIPYGQTLSYEALAAKLFENDKKTKDEIEKNAKNFSRAVGVALSKNPIMILIPCHRVIGKDGKLVGFAGGIELKDSLLTKEMLYYK
jgi:O-6-methylguanine DNA methyltransferase